jgi:hypothetical protein
MNFQDVQGLVLIYKDIPGIDLNSRHRFKFKDVQGL